MNEPHEDRQSLFDRLRATEAEERRLEELADALRQSGPSGRRPTLIERLRAIDRVQWTVFALFAIALFLHLWHLGDRAGHHDESQHAAFSYYFATGGGYQHNPLLHGPSQFHAMALIFKIFGDSDFTARAYHAVMGSLLVLSPLLLRRTLGSWGTVLAAVFLVISPSLLYYSRFAREDIPVVLFTVMMFAGVWRYRTDQRLRWLLLTSAGLALSFSSKETTYISAAVLLLYLDAAVAHALFAQYRRGEPATLLDRAAHGVWLIPTAWIFVAFWRPLGLVRQRLNISERPPEADVLLIVGTLVLPELSALASIPLHQMGLAVVDGSHQTTIDFLIILGMSLAAAFVGWLWRWEWWFACAAIFLAIAIPLYASMGTNHAGVGGLYWNSLSYWLDQQEVRRGTQPWFYYFMMVPLYEMLTLLPVLIGGLWLAIRRQDQFAMLLLWWFGGTFLALSFAGEKMPWLTTHMALPLAILAAYVLGWAIPEAWRSMRAGDGPIAAWAGGWLGTAALVLLLVVTVRADIGLNVWHPDTPVEPLIYTQSTPEIPALAREIRARIADGRAKFVFLDDTPDADACGADSCGTTWPWAWYLRHEGIVYAVAGQIERGEIDSRAIVIRPRGAKPAPAALESRSGDIVAYRHRWWFPEEGYRSITLGGLVRGVANGSLLVDWARFAWDRGNPDQIDSLDGVVYFPK